MNIYVSNLDCRLTEDSIKAAFQAYGEVASVRILTDRNTGHPKGVGLVEMPDKDEALKAIEALNGTELGGRTIMVNESHPEPGQNDQRGKSGIKEIQTADDPTASQPDSFPSFTDIRIRGALADAADSPSVAEVHKRVEKLDQEKPNIPWLKIIKFGSVAIGIPTMFGVLAFTIFNYLYPQKVKDFLARSKLFPRRPTVVSPRHLPRAEVNTEFNIRFAEGEKLISQGRNREALLLFTRLQQSKRIGPVERSKVWNRLGRLYAASDQPQKALSAFRKSFQTDPNRYESYVDHAVLLRDQGDWDAAMESVKKALEINPDDGIAKTIEQQLAERLALERDKERKQYLDQLIKKFSTVYPDKPNSLPSISPEMRTFILLDLISRGRIPDRLGESDYIKQTLIQSIYPNEGVKLGEQVLIDKLLVGLKLGPSETIDPKVLVRLGRILSTRCIAVGTIHRSEKESEIILKLTDTKTSETFAVLTKKITTPDSLKKATKVLAAKIIKTLNRRFRPGSSKKTLKEFGTKCFCKYSVSYKLFKALD